MINTTLTLNPVVDGCVGNTSLTTSWSSIRTGGNYVSSVGAETYEVIQLSCGGITNQFTSHRKAIFIFDTSVLSGYSNYVIEYAKLTVTLAPGGSYYYLARPYLSLSAVDTSYDDHLVAEDHNDSRWGDSALNNFMGIWGWPPTDPYLFNSGGIAALNPTGLTKLGSEMFYYETLPVFTPEWVSSGSYTINMYSAASAYPPVLTIKLYLPDESIVGGLPTFRPDLI